MIDLKCKIHDANSFEMKIWLVNDSSSGIMDFDIGTWFIVPPALDINRTTFTRRIFYANTRSYYRLITPRYSLEGMISSESSPLSFLRNSVSEIASGGNVSGGDLSYQVKMFTSIFKSAVRERATSMKSYDPSFSEDVKRVLSTFYELSADVTDDSCMRHFMSGYEYMLSVALSWAYGLYGRFEEFRSLVIELEKMMTDAGFLTPSVDDPEGNAKMLHRWGELKKYSAGELYFSVNTRRDGILAEQFYYSIAAGLSMIFATIVAFSFQKKYGNFTMPLFVALVISYMLKDRIKDFMRYYFAHKRREKYFDNRVDINIKGEKAGMAKEAFDFIKPARFPDFINDFISCRYLENYTVAYYKKFVTVDASVLNMASEYVIDGMNNIVRINFSSFFRNMDDPEAKLPCLAEDGSIRTVEVERIYYIYLIFELRSAGATEYRKIRLSATRDGLKSFDLLK